MTIRLFLRYNGTRFNGFQKQNVKGVQNPNVRTVQGTLDGALRKLLQDDSINAVGCSRTDAGVHANKYCVSFDVERSIVPPEKIAPAIGHLLPEDIVVYKSEPVEDGWNARYDVKSKTYKYFFYTGDFANPLYNDKAWFVKAPSLDLSAMQSFANGLIGEHDFTSFCGDKEAVASTIRTIYSLDIVKKSDNFYELSINGSGFLYNMVRIIAGTLVNVGEGKISPDDAEKIIAAEDRSAAGITAPPDGLYLWDVFY